VQLAPAAAALNTRDLMNDVRRERNNSCSSSSIPAAMTAISLAAGASQPTFD